MLAWISLAEMCGMTLWFSATAVAPFLIREYGMPSDQAAWLTMAVQVGFVAGTLGSALLNLPDVINARTFMGLGCMTAAIANVAPMFTSWSGASVIALRFVTGIALAAV